MQRVRWFIVVCLLVMVTPSAAQEPLTGAVYSAANSVYVRYPDGWVAFENGDALYLRTNFDIFGSREQRGMIPLPGEAFMVIRSRRYADTPRIPPNEDTLIATSRLVPGTAARDAYTATAEAALFTRTGKIDAPFLPNTDRYILFADQTRFVEVLVGAAPGEFTRFEPTFLRVLSTLTVLDAPPPDVPRARFGLPYFPVGYAGVPVRVDLRQSNLEFFMPSAWKFIEQSRSQFTLTNQTNANAPYLFPGDFRAEATFAEIPQDSVKTPLSLLYEALPAVNQRVLSVDTFNYNGRELARAVLSDTDFLVTTLLLEPPPLVQPQVEEGTPEPEPPQLTHYLTLRVTLGAGSFQQLESGIYDVITTAAQVNEPFYPFERIAYNNVNVIDLAPTPFISARADIATAIPAGWYASDAQFGTSSGVIVRRTNQPIPTDTNPLDVRPFENDALVRLTFFDLETSGEPLNAVPYLLWHDSANNVTLIDFDGQQVVRTTRNFDDFTYLLPAGGMTFMQARVRANPETLPFIEPRIIAMMTRTERRQLDSRSRVGQPPLDATFTARSQKVQFDLPENWFAAEFEDAAVSSALIGIPSDPDIPLRGDPASPEFQANADALLTITYVEPPTYAVEVAEGEFERRALPLFNYLYDVIGFNDVLPQSLTVAAYPALRRLYNGTGHILIQRTDGSVVQVYVQNLTSDDAANNYNFGYEDAMYAVLNTVRYPPADATEPTEPYVNNALGFRVEYPYDWTISAETFEFVEGEGDEQRTITETVVRFANVLDFSGAPGQAQISIQVEPLDIRRRYNVSRGGFLGRVEMLDAVNGATANGTLYTGGAVFTAQTTTPFRAIVIEMNTDDIDTFYPTLVKMIDSLEVIAAPPPEDADETAEGDTGDS